MDRSLIKLEEGPLITGYLGVELARVNTRGDIYPNARKLCVPLAVIRPLSTLSVRHHASSTMINVKNSAIKSEKKSAAGVGRAGREAPLVQILAVHLSSAVGFDPR